MVCSLLVILRFLCKLRFTRRFIHYLLKRWALLLTFLGRKLGIWHPWNDGKGDTVTRRKTARAGRSPGMQFESREMALAAASYLPAQHHVSGSGATGRPQPANPLPNATCTPTAHLTAEPHHRSCAYPTSSDGTDSHETGQTSQFLRAADGHLGHGLYASPSSERLSRSPFPRDDSPLLPPRTPVYVPSSPPSNPERRRRQSTTSAIVGVKGSSTESPHLDPLTNPSPSTGEPYVIGCPTTHSSPISDAPHLCEGPPQLSTRTSIILSNTNLPSDCSVKPMNPDQIPRYIRNNTVQVDDIITIIQRLHLLIRPRTRSDYEIPPLTTTFRPEQCPLENCAPWLSATHPDGALYFFDPARVRALAPI